MDREQLTNEFFTLKSRVEDGEDALKEMKKDLRSIEDKLIMIMENESLEKFTDDRYGTVFLSEQVYASVKDKGQAYEFLRSNGAADLIQETVNARTLSSYMKDIGQTEAPGISCHTETRIRTRRKS